MEQNPTPENVTEERTGLEEIQQDGDMSVKPVPKNEDGNSDNTENSTAVSTPSESSATENGEDLRQGTKRKPGEDSEEESKRICLTESNPNEGQYVPASPQNNDHCDHRIKEPNAPLNEQMYKSNLYPPNYQQNVYPESRDQSFQPPYQQHYEHTQHYEPQPPNLLDTIQPANSSSPPKSCEGSESENATPTSPVEPSKENPETVNIHDKLREMGEISVKPVVKSVDANAVPAKVKEAESEISVEIKKRTAEIDAETKRITNLRKNIREVMDENQLDATTLAAQRQESERLARVQVQQKIIRELQRQMAVERHNNRTQNRVLSLLQGQTSILRGSSSTGERCSSSQPGQSSHPQASSSDMYIVKGVASEVTFKGSNFVDIDKFPPGNLTPSVSIAPVRRMKSMIDSDMSEDESETEECEKKEVVEIVDSSSDDDCIVLSDDEEEEDEPEDDPDNSGLHVKDAYNMPDEQGRVLINIGHPENEEDIFLAPQIARIIKPHQIGGVRFLYDNIIESTERFSSSTGFGCILAHSMGLGKTLQVVCFCDIFLRHTNSKSILCILPINTLQNWMAEFNMWLPEDPEKSPHKVHGEVRPRNFKIFVLNDQQKTLSARSKVILEWAKVGGVLLIGYELFRLLSLKLANKKKRGKKGNLEKEKAETEAHKRTMEDIHAALVRPGPDLVICDEGHRIKNSHASISVALKQIRSKRRIVLTGYPLQNNLLEYWCMVDFVRPNYLGTKTEFANMFERPIQNGQCIDSTPQDIKLMRYRAHVLHSLLLGFVQRRSHVVLQNSLPQKEEYVILVRMTSFQRKLYNTFMNEVVRTKAVPNPLKAFAVCCKIWNHPDVLYNFLKKRETDLDLELEEVEADTKAITPATSNRGRKKGSTNKTTKGVNKNGKTIPAVEVQPNQTKLPSQPVSPLSEDIIPKTETQEELPSNSTDTAQIPTTVPSDPVGNMPPPSTIPPQTPSFAPLENTAHTLSSSLLPSEPIKQESSTEDLPPSSENHASNIADYSSNPSPNYTPQPPQAQNQQPYANNYNPYNPYEYDPYYAHQYGNMYSSQGQQYPGNPYDPQSYMSNSPHNYWQNNYYGYNNVGNPMNADPYAQGDPSYAGLVPKATESFDSSKPPSAEEKSSEIVDLDTKEIKTVEATIVEEDIKKPFEELKIKDEKEEEDANVKDVKESKDTIEVKQEIDVKEENKEKDDSSEECIALTPEKEKDLPRVSAKDDGIPYDWAVELMKGYVPDLLKNSPKMEIFFELLTESVNLGDRILVFSQSLLTLNLVERFLQKTAVPGCDYNWAKNTTYFRLDGSTSAMEREKLINEFNANPHIHLFLVSTRAGSLGINLVGANRVIVFDASWNPCHDTQAVCRVYRYGQKKPCFVYRIVMDNCLEKKIYDRQINKQGMSDRVVDECNPDAHLSMKEVTNLCYDNDDEEEIKDLTECKDKYLDVIMQKIIELHSDLLSKEPFHHESLLVDRKEKKLSQAEKRLAQRGYEMEKRAAAKPAYVYHSMGTQYRIMKTSDGSIVHRPVASVRPMQAEGGDKMHGTRPGGVRPTRWIPAEVWQRQGMTAQEMTLPLDVVIPTSSGDKSNIVLKAGQKVMVLKSPKGIYMQLETGKIIAIRTSVKMGQNQNKEKVEENDAGSSSIGGPDDLLGKAPLKTDQTPSSPGHHASNSSSPFSMNNNAVTGNQGKQSSYSADANRGGKGNVQSPAGTPFKANSMMQNRTFPQTPNTNNSKNFNVQSLIDGKVSTGQQNASIYSHAKNADMMFPESHRNMNSPGGHLNKTSLYNAATKSNYPRSNYSFTNALKQAQSGNQQTYANVKPQAHEDKMWEQHKSQSGKNAESSLTTITIDDDIDPPLREKVVYKPNLIERKSKHQSHRNTMQSPTATMGMSAYGKQSPNKNPHPHMQGSNTGHLKGSENLRQLHNVKPYNRQYPEHRGMAASNKPIEDSMQTQSMPNSSTSQQQDVKSSGGRSKMPSIRNIPAPFPSACMGGISQAATQSNLHNPPTYTQSNMPPSSQENGSNNTTHPISSYSSEQNTQHNQENPDYQAKNRSSSSQQNSGNESSNTNEGLNLSKTSTVGNEKSHPASPQSQQPQHSASNQKASAPTSISNISHTNSDAQYTSYNQQQQSTPNPYSSNPNDSSFNNFSRPDIPPYQTPYGDMYASGPPNPYSYPSTGQHHPPPQGSYPYGSYFDHQMYGSTSTQNYGSSSTVPPSVPPHQQGQYHYPNYQPPPGLPPQSSDPYSSYYNYPPYPPQAGQWQP